MQIVVNRTLINYEVLGNNKKNILVLLHGWGGSLAEWIPIALAFTDSYKVILLDLPGFGNSYIPEEITLDIYDYATIVEEFLHKLDISKFVILGHSFGGKIATVISSRNKWVSKLILVAPSGFGTRSFFTNVRIYIFKFMSKTLIWLPDALKQKILEKFASRDYKDAGDLQKSFKMIVEQGVKKEAKKIKARALILWGDKDRELSVKTSRVARGLIPNSVVRIVWGAGHFPHIEKQEEFLNLLEEFV